MAIPAAGLGTEKGSGPTDKATKRPPMARWFPVLRVAIPLAVGIALDFTPVPQGLSRNAWLYFALFAAVITGVITEPLPAAAVGLAGIVIAAVSGLVYASPSQATAWALASFGNGTVWLIFAAYMFALGYTKTGLGRRIALLLIRAMGKRTLGLGYAIALADLALAPLMPSNTARSAGTIYPVICNIPELYGSRPHDESARKIGAYLMYTALASTCVTSSMFLTGLAPNLLSIAMAAKAMHVTISWIDWFKGFAPAGVILFALVPALLYKIYPPEIKLAPDVSRWAAEELRKMGAVTKKEFTLLALVTAALVLWIGGAKYIDATIAAVLAVVLMVLFRVVSWDEVVGHRKLQPMEIPKSAGEQPGLGSQAARSEQVQPQVRHDHQHAGERQGIAVLAERLGAKAPRHKKGHQRCGEARNRFATEDCGGVQKRPARESLSQRCH